MKQDFVLNTFSKKFSILSLLGFLTQTYKQKLCTNMYEMIADILVHHPHAHRYHILHSTTKTLIDQNLLPNLKLHPIKQNVITKKAAMLFAPTEYNADQCNGLHLCPLLQAIVSNSSMFHQGSLFFIIKGETSLENFFQLIL